MNFNHPAWTESLTSADNSEGLLFSDCVHVPVQVMEGVSLELIIIALTETQPIATY